MARPLQEIVAEIQALHISRATLPHYFALCDEVEALLPPLEAQDVLYKAVDAYRDELLELLVASVGDGRAKDLINRADDAPNPWHAIALLYDALRYGRTTIQAQKAFLRLGERYAAIHNSRRALKYLSRALNLAPDLPVARFARGMVYYRQGHWKHAAADLTQFLATSDVKETWPEYAAEANAHLREMHLSQTIEKS